MSVCFFRIVFQIIFIISPILLLISWIVAPNELILLHGFVKLNAIPTPYSGTYIRKWISQHAILHTLTVGEKSWAF